MTLICACLGQELHILVDRRGTSGGMRLPLHTLSFIPPPRIFQVSHLFCAGALVASVDGSCVAEIRELPYDGNMWAAVCLRCPRQKVHEFTNL